MKIVGQQIRLAGSDLSNHLACRHLTTLELQVVRGERAAPDWADPDLAIILERGDRHEKDYLAHLAAQGLTVENLGHIDHKEEARLLAETLALMDRGAEYAAYSRFVMKRLRGAVGEGASKETYPEPVEHCNVCRWFKECDARRRADDHLSLVAGIRRQQRDQFEEWNAETMAKLAALPIPLRERPKHGSKAGYEKVQEQARVQVEGRTEKRPVHEPILPVAEGMGFCRLPEPSVGEVFVDLEGDPFVGEKGLQYPFGFRVLDVPGGR